MKLYLVDPLDNVNAKLNIVLALTDSQAVVVPCDRKAAFQKDAQRLFPLVAFPALQTDDGVISGHNAIALYLCQQSQSLLGSSRFQKARVIQFLFWLTEQSSCFRALALHALGKKTLTPQELAPVQKQLQSALKRVQGMLQSRTFILGDQLTLGDIALICQSRIALLHEPGLSKDYPGVFRWLNLVSSIDPIRNRLAPI